jgi:hypothetical protein
MAFDFSKGTPAGGFNWDEGMPLDEASGVPERKTAGVGADVSGGSDIFNRLKSTVAAPRNAAVGLLTGQAKAIGGMVAGAGNIGIQTLGKLIPGLNEREAAEKAMAQTRDITRADGLAEQLGSGVTNFASLAVPLGQAGAVGQLASRAGKIGGAIKVVAEAVKTGAISASQAGDLEQGGKAGLATGAILSVLGVSGKILEKALPGMSSYLEKINLRLTPPQKRALGGKLDSAVNTIKQKIPAGSPTSRLQKAEDLVELSEDKFQNFLKEGAKDKTVKKEVLKEQIEALKSKYANDRDIISIEGQLDGFRRLLDTKYSDDVPVELLNTLKRSTYKNAYNKAGDKVVDYVEHEIGDVLRRAIEEATEGVTIQEGGKALSLSAFNKEYGSLLEARKLLDIARTRPEIGLVGKLISTGVGATIGGQAGPIGSAVGMATGQNIANVLAGTAARSILAKTFEQASKLQGKQGVELLWKAILPYLNQKDE